MTGGGQLRLTRCIRPLGAVGDYLVLMQGANHNRTRVDAIVPPLYHNLKMIAHIPFALYLICIEHATNPSTAPFPAADLVAYNARLGFAQPTINKTRYPDPTMLARQQGMLRDAQAFVTTALSKGSISLPDLLAFTHSMTDRINANVQDAAISRLDLLNSVVQIWRANVVAPADWQGLRFIVHSSHMAVTGDLGVQVSPKSFVLSITLHGVARCLCVCACVSVPLSRSEVTEPTNLVCSTLRGSLTTRRNRMASCQTRRTNGSFSWTMR